jgi:hypothetical protein
MAGEDSFIQMILSPRHRWPWGGAESIALSPTFLARLRASPVARVFVLWLMLLQVIFTAEHLSAKAAAATWERSASGLLDICRVALDEAGQPGPVQLPKGAPDPQSCLLCAAVSAAGLAVASAPPALTHVFAVVGVPLRWTVAEPALSPRRLHSAPIRGPPPSYLL